MWRSQTLNNFRLDWADCTYQFPSGKNSRPMSFAFGRHSTRVVVPSAIFRECPAPGARLFGFGAATNIKGRHIP
jgi:hypothetical protein